MNQPDRVLARQLIGETWLPLVAHLSLLGLLLILAWPVVPRRVLVLWSSSVVVISLLRSLLWKVMSARDFPPMAIQQWVRIAMLLLGLAWGVGTAVTIRFLPTADASLVLLGLTGLIAGGLATLVADRWVFPIYATAMLVPPGFVVALIEPGLFDEMGVILIVAYLAFTIRLHRRSHAELLARLHTAAELRERERQLAQAQEIAHVGSWEWDIPTNVVTWSAELRRMYGVSMDAPAGYAEFLERAHPDDRARLEAMLARSLATREASDYEWRCVRPDGEVRHMLSRNVVMTDSTGEAVRMAGTSLDITERTRAAEEIKVLRGILPICASCKRIRSDNGSWEPVESYVRDHTNAEFSHGLCPDCAARDWGSAAGLARS